MTIRVEHLTIVPDPCAWIASTPDTTDVTNDETVLVDALSLVRHIMRERPCDTIPVINMFLTHKTNEWGHNATIEVTYSKQNYRAIYGARLDSGVKSVSCYMD